MRITAVRPRQLAAAAMLLTVPLVGCSSSHGEASPTGSTGPGGETTAAAPTSPASSPPSTEPTAGLGTWPTAPATVGSSGLPKVVRPEVVAAGYTGTAFLAALTRKWHIELGSRAKSDFSAKDDRAAVWHAEGTSRPAGGTELGVAVVWDLDGTLKSLTCTASAKAPGRAAFLRACVRLDHPGSDPAAAARWLDGVTASVDRAYRKAGLTVDSPLFRKGGAVSYLQEYGGNGSPVTYALHILGAAK